MKRIASFFLFLLLLCLSACSDGHTLPPKPPSAPPSSLAEDPSVFLPSHFPLEEVFPDYEGSVTLWYYYEKHVEMGSRSLVLEKKVIDSYLAGVISRAFLDSEKLETALQREPALSDRPFEEFTAETLPAKPHTFFLSLDAEDRLYRFHEMPILVNEFLGEGEGWQTPDAPALSSLLFNAFFHFPYDSYRGTAKDGLTVNRVLKMPAPLKIAMTDLKRSQKQEHGCPIDEITLTVYALEEVQNAGIAVKSDESDDVILGSADTTLSLKKGERKTVKLSYLGSASGYMLTVTAPHTRITLDVHQSFFER